MDHSKRPQEEQIADDDGFETQLKDVQVILGPRMAPNDPKIVDKCLKWPQCHQSDFQNHLHQNSAPFAVVLSGNMTSLRHI